jgi:hypothetical protein
VKTASLIAALFFVPGIVTAQEAVPAQPDFSREKLIEIFAGIPTPPEQEKNIHFHLGSVEFKALGTRWRIAYIPFMMPFSGSVNYGRVMGSDFPDPFALTGTEIAYTPRTWRDQRAMSSELRRIERSERQRAKVSATVKSGPE